MVTNIPHVTLTGGEGWQQFPAESQLDQLQKVVAMQQRALLKTCLKFTSKGYICPFMLFQIQFNILERIKLIFFVLIFN